MHLRLHTTGFGKHVWYARTEDGNYDATSDDAMAAVMQVAEHLEEDILSKLPSAKVPVKFKQSGLDNTIQAETTDGVLLGVWFNQRNRGSYRIGNGTVPPIDAPVAYLHDLTAWISIMQSYAR